MFYRSGSLASHTQARTFIEASMLSSGYTKALDDSSYLGFRVKNTLNTPTGFDAFFDVVFIADGTDLGITVAQALPSTNLIPKADAPKSSVFTADFKIEIVVTNFNVAMAAIDNAGNRHVFVACTIDYRELDLDALASDTTNLNNIRNNGHCCFRVGSTGRLLYSGIAGSPSFNAPLVIDNPVPNPSNQLMEALVPTLPVAIPLAGTTGRYYGVLKDTYITRNSAPFHRDTGVDQNGRSHIFLRDSNGYAVIIGET